MYKSYAQQSSLNKFLNLKHETEFLDNIFFKIYNSNWLPIKIYRITSAVLDLCRGKAGNLVVQPTMSWIRL